MFQRATSSTTYIQIRIKQSASYRVNITNAN